MKHALVAVVHASRLHRALCGCLDLCLDLHYSYGQMCACVLSDRSCQRACKSAESRPGYLHFPEPPCRRDKRQKTKHSKDPTKDRRPICDSQLGTHPTREREREREGDCTVIEATCIVSLQQDGVVRACSGT